MTPGPSSPRPSVHRVEPPNLSTWAEPLIKAREQREEEARRAAEVAENERQLRARHRTLVAAGLDAFAQQVVVLINRLDADRFDSEASESLRTSSRLTPEAFSPELIEILTSEAEVLRSAALLDALVAVQGASDPPSLHDLCVRAVGDGWGRPEGCRHLSGHGRVEDISDDFLQSVILHAAPSGLFMSRHPGQPDALRRYHSIAPEMVEGKICSLLRHGESWRRAAGAAAADALGAQHPDALVRLLPALLDGLRYQEDQFDHEDATGHIAAAVAHLLAVSPGIVDDAIVARWSKATPAYRARIVACLDHLVRHTQHDLSLEVASVLINRACVALFEPYDIQRHNIDDDYQQRAAYLLGYAIRHAPAESLSLDVLLGLLLLWIDRRQEVDDWTPDGHLAVLQKLGAEAHIGGLVRRISEAVTAAGLRDPASFLVVCLEALGGVESPIVRAELFRLLGEVTSGSAEHLDEALPPIYTAILGEDQGVRAAGIEAATAVMRRLPKESIPPLLCEAVVAGLSDQYLIVVTRAIKALHHIPVDAVDADRVAVLLLLVAQSYAPDRLRDRMVRDALSGALRFSGGDGAVDPIVRSAANRIVGQMPPYNARDTLRWISALRDDPDWTNTAIAALRPDDDPQYEHLGDDDKEALLVELSGRSLTPEQVERLSLNEVAAGRHDRSRALLGADAIAELHRPDLAAEIVRAHLQQIPDTIERSGERRSVQLLLLQYELEAAVARGDKDQLREIEQEVADAAPDEGG